MGERSSGERYSLAIYFLLVFLIAWMGSFVGVGPKFLAGKVIESRDVVLMASAMLTAPFIAGLLITYLGDGAKGIKELFARMKKYNVAGRWYLPLLIFPGLLFSISVLLGVLLSPELAPVFSIVGIFAGPLVGFLEETGWTGFAYPRMTAKGSVLGTSIYLGVIHGFWHIVADFLGNFNTMGGYWLPYFVGFFLHVVALRVLIVWIYSNTESLFLAILTHASSTGFYAILISTTMTLKNLVIFYNVYGIVLCLVASIVALKYGRTLTIKSRSS